ncbi:type I Zorya anti-phage system protein ZorC [Escherichia sp. E2586]|uniref:type I Zorya anti-phage system protein ZorC n=1 Tax=Escherichia sp. E2586 TaxID=2044457 RepID=UPI001F0D04CB|nr:type I Zorya anti-phage system protein ZorC [Escherichia sp. E2586]
MLARCRSVPPLEKRRQAIARLRAGDTPKPFEWKMIFFGLNDVAEGDLFEIALIDDAKNFARIIAEIEQKIAQQRLTRREWLALCTSYFGHSSDTPEKNPQWLQLRTQIARGFQQLKESAPRQMSWMSVIDTYSDIFTDNAGFLLGQQLGRGDITDISVLEKVAQIPQTSWLWRKIVNHLVNEIFCLTDDDFQQKIHSIIALSRQLTRFKDNILAATLTRYYQSAFKHQTHFELKQLALEYWGNPQLTSRNKSWQVHVENPVLLMVQGWFAKDDLKLFFELLKGNRDVDHARLFYWLRFATQMSYTRIVLGEDALRSKDVDYVEFRAKNAGRLSRLQGFGSRDNNAMIMRIGDYLFVEFSKVGAMYAYHMGNAPFNPETGILDIDYDLKDKRNNRRKVRLRLPHLSPVFLYSLNRIEGWMSRYDEELRKLGIDYVAEDINQSSVTLDISRFNASKTMSRSVPASLPEREVSDAKSDREEQIKIIASSLKAKKGLPDREQQIREIIRSVDCKVMDKRGLGGAIHIHFNEPDHEAAQKLLSLGFKPVLGKFTYWSK